MNFEIKEYPNYYGEVVALDEFRTLEGCDNVKAAVIFSNQVIVSKDSKEGDLGIFFPLEVALSEDFLSGNNLYNKSLADRNVEPRCFGFFESKGRVRAVRFRGHASDGFFIPLKSMEVLGFSVKDFTVGDKFQDIDGIPVCWKYTVKPKEVEGAPKPGKKARRAQRKALKTCIVEGQLVFHYDTAQARRNAQRITPETVLSMSYKEHGCVSYDSLVDTIQGPMKIGDVVEAKISTRILARDLTINEDVYVPIEQFYKKEDDGEWFLIELEDGTTLEITGNNPVWLPELNCYRRVDELTLEDFLLLKEA